jgi:methylmalonyl-CoA mutase C-terminal domain/subunit
MAQLRVLVAKPGLDGHDRGAKLVAQALRDAGVEVVYLGLRQTPAQVAATAVAEDVDLVGLSILSGSHLKLTRRVLDALAEQDAEDIPVLVGGSIPHRDVERLLDMGVAAVLPTSTPLTDVVAAVHAAAEPRRAGADV